MTLRPVPTYLSRGESVGEIVGMVEPGFLELRVLQIQKKLMLAFSDALERRIMAWLNRINVCFTFLSLYLND